MVLLNATSFTYELFYELQTVKLLPPRNLQGLSMPSSILDQISSLATPN